MDMSMNALLFGCKDGLLPIWHELVLKRTSWFGGGRAVLQAEDLIRDGGRVSSKVSTLDW